MDIIIGSHVSFKKDEQLLGSVKETLSYDANTFMLYTGAPQNTIRMPIDAKITKEALELMKNNDINISNVVCHAPYIINLGSNKNNNFSIEFLKEEIKRAESLEITKLVVHPGSHIGMGLENGINNVAFVLNKVLNKGQKVVILLETMSGKGSEIGADISSLASIINKVDLKEKVGICLDTCHLNDAGYNLNDFDTILAEIDNKIGINKIGCIHINDSKNDMGSHKDRHANIGFGKISFDTLLKIIYHNKLKKIPKILETPYVEKIENSNDKVYPPYKFEIEMIINKQKNSNLFTDIRTYYK